MPASAAAGPPSSGLGNSMTIPASLVMPLGRNKREMEDSPCSAFTMLNAGAALKQFEVSKEAAALVALVFTPSETS